MDWNILGHEWAVEILKKQISLSSLRHAYLITGPAGVGRRTLALRFAQAINCANSPEPGEACQTCKTCTQIKKQMHPDLQVVQAESVGGVLKVDQIRELQRSLSLAPYAAKYRVALLLRFEEAQRHAANALLKTLEEPLPSVMLLLTAETPEDLPETILSRCQLLRLRPMPIDQLAVALADSWGVSPDQARLLAHISSGRPGVARKLHAHPEILEERNILLDEHEKLLPADRVVRFAFAERAANNKETLRELLELWGSFWRDVMLTASQSSAPLTNIDRTETIRTIANRVDTQIAHQMLLAIEASREHLDRNVNTRLVTENLMLTLPHL